jgi:hypothetical protein
MESLKDVRQIVEWNSYPFVTYGEQGGRAVWINALLDRNTDWPTIGACT